MHAGLMLFIAFVNISCMWTKVREGPEDNKNERTKMALRINMVIWTFFFFFGIFEFYSLLFQSPWTVKSLNWIFLLSFIVIKSNRMN